VEDYGRNRHSSTISFITEWIVRTILVNTCGNIVLFILYVPRNQRDPGYLLHMKYILSKNTVYISVLGNTQNDAEFSFFNFLFAFEIIVQRIQYKLSTHIHTHTYTRTHTHTLEHTLNMWTIICPIFIKQLCFKIMLFFFFWQSENSYRFSLQQFIRIIYGISLNSFILFPIR